MLLSEHRHSQCPLGAAPHGNWESLQESASWGCRPQCRQAVLTVFSLHCAEVEWRRGEDPSGHLRVVPSQQVTLRVSPRQCALGGVWTLSGIQSPAWVQLTPGEAEAFLPSPSEQATPLFLKVFWGTYTSKKADPGLFSVTTWIAKGGVGILSHTEVIPMCFTSLLKSPVYFEEFYHKNLCETLKYHAFARRNYSHGTGWDKYIPFDFGWTPCHSGFKNWRVGV